MTEGNIAQYVYTTIGIKPSELSLLGQQGELAEEIATTAYAALLEISSIDTDIAREVSFVREYLSRIEAVVSALRDPTDIPEHKSPLFALDALVTRRAAAVQRLNDAVRLIVHLPSTDASS